MVEWTCAGVLVGVAVGPWVATRPEPLLLLLGTTATLWSALGYRRPTAWGLSGLVLGVLMVAAQPPGPELRGLVAIQGTIVGGGLGRTTDMECTRWAPPGGQWRPCEGRVRLAFRDRSPGPGVSVIAQGVAHGVGGYPVLPGAPDPVRAADRGRVRSQLRIRAYERLGMGPRRGCTIDDRTGVLCAVATGVRTQLDPEILDTLRATGTAHVLAISGFHVGVVAALGGSLAFGLLRWTAALRPSGVGRAPAWIAGATAALGYAWLAGAPTSARRAALLVVLAALIRLWGGELRPLRMLGMVAVVVTLLDPPCVGTAGFQLSFGAVLGIIRVGPRLDRWIPPDLPWPVEWATRAMTTSVAATVGTLPALAWWFQELPPLSPIANLIALPWCAIAVVPMAALASIAPDPLAGWAAAVGTASVEVLVTALHPLALQPWSPAVGPIGAAALLCWVVWPRRLFLCLLISWLALGMRIHAVDRITFLDVGQGDAAVAEVGGRTWLIDGGPAGERVLQYLTRRGLREIDVVVATHEQVDHVGGLGPVLEHLEVGEVWVSEEGSTAEMARELGIPVVVAPPEVIHPRASFRPDDPNDRSLVFELGGVLFTGDIERRGERAVQGELTGPIPVLKVAHHGSRTSSTESFLDAVDPLVAVIGVGRRNVYRHPSRLVLDRLRARGVRVYRTDQDGTVEVSVHPEAVWVRTWKPGRGWSGTARYQR